MTATEDARRVLHAVYGTESFPLPVDPVAVARRLGINVYSSKLENSLSGMLAKLDPESDINMIVNSEHSPARQRFTAAHEIGHFYSNFKTDPQQTRTYVHKRDSLSSCGTDREEVYANQFAAELLMPEREVRRMHRAGLGPLELARRFQVSLDAMGHRLTNLRLPA